MVGRTCKRRHIPTTCPDDMSRRHVPTTCPDDMSRRHDPTTCPDDMSRRHVPTTCPDDMSRRHVPTTCPDDMSRRHVPTTCPDDISRRHMLTTHSDDISWLGIFPDTIDWFQLMLITFSFIMWMLYEAMSYFGLEYFYLFWYAFLLSKIIPVFSCFLSFLLFKSFVPMHVNQLNCQLMSWPTHLASWFTHLMSWLTHLVSWPTHLMIFNSFL